MEMSDHSSVICITRANNAVKGGRGRVPSGRSSLPPHQTKGKNSSSSLTRSSPSPVQTIFCSFFIHSLRQCLTPRPHGRNCARRGYLTTRHKFASPWRLFHNEITLTLQIMPALKCRQPLSHLRDLFIPRRQTNNKMCALVMFVRDIHASQAK